MTDEQITRALAEKVMGWKVGEDGSFSNMGWDEIHFAFNWNPLTDDAAACAVLDKVGEDGWHVCLTYGWEDREADRWHCSFEREYPMWKYGECYDDCRRRAICIAALKAIEAWEDPTADEASTVSSLRSERTG